MLFSKSTFKKIILTGLSAAMIVTGATSAFAKGNGKAKGAHEPKFNHHNNASVQIKIEFSDLDEQKYEWVLQNIARLAAKRVFEGYDDGTFRPQKPITQLEAIIAAVRLMGLREQAESPEEMQADLSFRDANLIERKFPNAVGYVSVALKNDLFNENDTSVNPEKPATRLWSTILLVKALKLDDQAKEMMNDPLTFRDAKDIPAGSRGYVALAVKKGLVSGYLDNTFRPNKPVTRAELAALLDRTGDQMPDYNNGTIEGTVSAAVQNNLLAIVQNGETKVYTVDPNAFVFKNGKKVPLSDLRVGDKISARSVNNVIIFIQVTDVADVQETFTAKVAAPVDSENRITLRKNNADVTYTFADNAIIYRNGAVVRKTAVKAGDTVFVRATNQVIQLLQVIQTVNERAEYTGKITAVNTNANVLTISKDNQTSTFTVDANALIIRKGTVTTLAALKTGDEVKVLTLDNKVMYVLVMAAVEDQVQSFTVDGLYHSLTLNSKGEIATISVTQSVYENPQISVYNVAPNVTITGNTANLVPLHPIKLYGENQVVNKIEIK
ncbi:MAG TPA: S-layer homology domain-containing protein [Bacilli bacterium]